MLVCECRGFTEEKIRSLIRAGCDSLPLLETVCGVGVSCGGCRKALVWLLEQETGRLLETASEIPPL